MTDYVAIPGPLGAMLVAADERALLGVWFEGQKYHPAPAGWTHRPAHPLLARAAPHLRGSFEHRRPPGFGPPPPPPGPPLPQADWAGPARARGCGGWCGASRRSRLRAARRVGCRVATLGSEPDGPAA